jgi:hypothetical protein
MKTQPNPYGDPSRGMRRRRRRTAGNTRRRTGRKEAVPDRTLPLPIPEAILPPAYPIVPKAKRRLPITGETQGDGIRT